MKKIVYEAPKMLISEVEDEDIFTKSGYLDWEEEGGEGPGNEDIFDPDEWD